MPRTNVKADVKTVLYALLLLGLPITAAQLTLDGSPYHGGEASSPYGYTVSLLIFIVPVLALGYLHIRHPVHPANRTALVCSAATIAVLGSLLDLAFGHTFFHFPSPQSTLGIRLPAWSFGEMRWVPGYLPIEEFGFYILGGWFMVSAYLWFDQEWLSAFDPLEYSEAARAKTKLIHLSSGPLILWVALVAAGFGYKKIVPHEYNEGFPGYFVFLMTLGLLPALLCFRGIAKFVNWRAFACSSFILLLISVVWEATLALPYGWWDYKRESTIGIMATAWADLPIEAVMMWIISAWTSLLAFEFFRVYSHMGRRPMHALFGKEGSKRAADESAE